MKCVRCKQTQGVDFRMERRGQVRYFYFGFFYGFRIGSVRLVQNT